MQTHVSTKGQVVLPARYRRKLGIRAGDALDARIQAGNIVLQPRRKSTHKARIVTSPITGLPVLSLGKDAPVLTHEQVAEILSSFP